MAHSEPVTETTGDLVPKWLRSVLYVTGTIVLGTATAVGDAIPEPWGRLATGFGTAALLVAAGYRPTR